MCGPSDPPDTIAGRLQRVWRRSKEIVRGLALMVGFVAVASAWLVVSAVRSWRGDDVPELGGDRLD